MKRMVVLGVGIAAFVVGVATLSAGGPPTEPGVPGTPNCIGKTNSFLAQSAQRGDVDEAFHGIGGVGRFFDFTPQEIEALVRAYCAGEGGGH